MQLPVIDIGPMLTDAAGRNAVAQQIREACVQNGFFYIKGHGIDPALVEELDATSRQFFALPLEDKMQIRMSLAGKAWRGYFPLGDELTSGKPDLKEGVYFGEELPSDDHRVKKGLPMHGGNLFPASMPKFRTTVLNYMSEMEKLGHVLMRALSISLDLDENYIHNNYTYEPLILFRVFHYPSQENSTEGQWGVGEHTDYGLITILNQDSSGGLQVKSKSGWIEAPPIPGTFICNIGDMLDRLTRGYYRSTPHRVLNTSGMGRLSFPFFFDPAFDAKLDPLPLSADQVSAEEQESRWDGQSVHRSIGTYGEYILGKVGKVFPDL